MRQMPGRGRMAGTGGGGRAVAFDRVHDHAVRGGEHVLVVDERAAAELAVPLRLGAGADDADAVAGKATDPCRGRHDAKSGRIDRHTKGCSAIMRKQEADDRDQHSKA